MTVRQRSATATPPQPHRERRRLVLALGAAAAFAAPLRSMAQAAGAAPQKIFRIGLLHVGTDHVPPAYVPLKEGMRGLGYEEGRNIRYDFRNVDSDAAALAAAHDLVRERVDLVVTFDSEAARAVFAAVKSIPVVMLHVNNPVAAGYVKSLAHPGGNITGLGGFAELAGKNMQILQEMKPRLSKGLLLVDPRDPASTGWRDEARAGASVLGIKLVERSASDAAGLQRLFAALKPGTAEAVLFASGVLQHRHQALVLALATKHGMPLVATRRAWVEQGALFAYNFDFARQGRLAANRYIDRILKGKLPADLPLEEITEYQLVVNRATAKRYGMNLPQSVLIRAHEIIE